MGEPFHLLLPAPQVHPSPSLRVPSLSLPLSPPPGFSPTPGFDSPGFRDEDRRPAWRREFAADQPPRGGARTRPVEPPRDRLLSLTAVPSSRVGAAAAWVPRSAGPGPARRPEPPVRYAEARRPAAAAEGWPWDADWAPGTGGGEEWRSVARRAGPDGLDKWGQASKAQGAGDWMEAGRQEEEVSAGGGRRGVLAARGDQSIGIPPPAPPPQPPFPA